MSAPTRNVVTRFAPSPTGFLHIGGARTALFNWLFARHHGGKFLLRIEDTDRKRSSQAAIDAILDGMTWLGLDWDEEPVFQFSRAARHAEVACQLLAEGKAYNCYCTPEELDEMRRQAKAEGRFVGYDGRWRDRDPSEAPAGVPPVIRLKMPQEGESIIEDAIQGEVKVANSQLDDMVLLRADGTPTYMLSVVVDDHDMGITHVIRGDDHLINAFRQRQLFLAMGWDVPVFAHLPLIHGPDGAKLSKRHGAIGAEQYREQGYLPEALRNYILRLGWSHGDEEIIPTDKAIEWFDLDAVGKSAARFDFAKLDNLNGYYIRETDDDTLASLVLPFLPDLEPGAISPEGIARLTAGMPGLKSRAKTLVEMGGKAAFYVKERPLALDDKAKALLEPDALALLNRLVPRLEEISDWTHESVETVIREFAAAEEVKLNLVAQPLRAALTGSNVSPGIFEMVAVLGREETLGRIADINNQ